MTPALAQARKALDKIASWTQTEGLLWWQIEARSALAAIDAALEGGGWLPIESAPKDGTHIIALLYRGATEDMDGRKHRAFTEVREIFYKPYSIFGMDLPWHAGDPMDSHDGVGADSHMGEAVPIGWLPRSALPLPPVGALT